MLDDRARGDITQAHPRQAEALDQRAQDRREHVLVADRRVSRVRPGERNTHAADDGNAPHRCTDQH
jgi:hypothetical protein